MNPEDMIVGDPHKDMKVLGNVPIEEYNKYRGEWVAIVDAKIVAHGKDPGHVLDEGYRIGKGLPFMDYVYKDYGGAVCHTPAQLVMRPLPSGFAWATSPCARPGRRA